MANCSTCPVTYEQVQEAADWILDKLPQKPKIGVVCGSKFGSLANMLQDKIDIPCHEIPNYPEFTTDDRSATLSYGIHEGIPIIYFNRRFYLHQGYSSDQIVLPVRLLKLLGGHLVILINSVGAVNPAYSIGDVMVLKDHINMVGFSGNDTIKLTDTRWGSASATIKYDKNLREKALEILAASGFPGKVHEGIYVCSAASRFQTAAETNLLKSFGCDVVGTTVIHEAIAAAQCGIDVMALSIVSSVCTTSYDSSNKEEDLNLTPQLIPFMKQYVEIIAPELKSQTEMRALAIVESNKEKAGEEEEIPTEEKPLEEKLGEDVPVEEKLEEEIAIEEKLEEENPVEEKVEEEEPKEEKSEEEEPKEDEPTEEKSEEEPKEEKFEEEEPKDEEPKEEKSEEVEPEKEKPDEGEILTEEKPEEAKPEEENLEDEKPAPEKLQEDKPEEEKPPEEKPPQEKPEGEKDGKLSETKLCGCKIQAKSPVSADGKAEKKPCSCKTKNKSPDVVEEKPKKLPCVCKTQKKPPGGVEEKLEQEKRLEGKSCACKIQKQPPEQTGSTQCMHCKLQKKAADGEEVKQVSRGITPKSSQIRTVTTPCSSMIQSKLPEPSKNIPCIYCKAQYQAAAAAEAQRLSRCATPQPSQTTTPVETGVANVIENMRSGTTPSKTQNKPPETTEAVNKAAVDAEIQRSSKCPTPKQSQTTKPAEQSVGNPKCSCKTQNKPPEKLENTLCTQCRQKIEK